MIYRVLAEFVLVVHFAFVVYAVLGGILVLRWRWTAWLHLPVVAWGALVETLGWVCPLTPLENDLRSAAGISGYPGGFVDHYIIPVLYPDNLTRTDQLLLGLVLVAINVVIYGFVIRNSRDLNSPEP